MADAKLSALAALLGANVDATVDLLYIDDVSVTTSKKITVDELLLGMLASTTNARFKVVNTTFDMTTATGATKVITGVGFKPKAVFAMIGFGANSNNLSIGWTDGVAEANVANVNAEASGNWICLTNSLLFADQGSATNQIFSIVTGGSLDADGCTLRNTKVGSPSGTVNISLFFLR